MDYDRKTAYNQLPPIPPAIDLETRKILKKVNTANKALGELKGWGLHQSNPYLLLQTISLQEAKASSEIENIVTTNDELYQAFSLDSTLHISPATKEVLHYKEALWKGYELIRSGHPLCISVFTSIFQTIKSRNDGIRTMPGTVLKNTMGDVVYTPPDNREDILHLLSNLENYINMPEDDVDPLIRLALIHYQFECIHPFPDGNGRTGRIINVLYLVQEGLLYYPTLYLSGYIISHKNDYYKLLAGVTERQEWEPWIYYILDAIEQTALHTLQMLKEIRDAKVQLSEEIKEKLPQMYSKELIDLLFNYPYCKISFLVRENIAKTQTASKYLNTLADMGWLHRVKRGREVYFINENLLRILTKPQV
ncbi:MAG TPA: addiction module protein [Dialister sp.]|nr:addiction module protein [Dialister sp.]